MIDLYICRESAKISIILNFMDNPGLLIQHRGAGRLRDLLSDKIIDGISI